MNRYSSSFSSSSGDSLISSSSSDNLIHALALIVLLRAVHNNDTHLVNDIPSVLIERNVDRLYDHYQISREIFRSYPPNSNFLEDDQIPAEDNYSV